MDAITFVESIVGLAHADNYDPVARKAYYERTKVLKGRRKGVTEESSGGRPGSFTPTGAKKPTGPSEDEAARVEALKARLDRLQEVLRQLVEAAKARSGVEPESKKSSNTKESSSDRKPLSSKQKREAAQRSKEYREKNEDKDTVESLEDDIEAVKAKIAKAREDLSAAIQRARQKQGSNSSSGGRIVPLGSEKSKGDRQNGSKANS